ncbi:MULTISPECIES: TIGR03086 family metal-binding protein [Streptomyces]|uniref:TIGR03086 family metal-binding protein n=1 Tax=Streptomyces TaxID=1883 RepID=UPI0006EB44A6|nr:MULTISPECIES: TIGR03086 family metal-binding protein [Streptomyces]
MNAATDPRPLLRRTADQFTALVATVEPGRLGDPTPCDAFDVRALIGHVLSGTHAYAQLAEGASSDPTIEDFSEVPDGDWTAAASAAAERLVTAGQDLDDDALERMVDPGFAAMPLHGALSAVVMEIAAHTWDLREALGAKPELDPETAEFSLAFAHRALRPERRGGPVPFGPVRQAPEGADAYDELAAWLGREVRPTA